MFVKLCHHVVQVFTILSITTLLTWKFLRNGIEIDTTKGDRKSVLHHILTKFGQRDDLIISQ